MLNKDNVQEVRIIGDVIEIHRDDSAPLRLSPITSCNVEASGMFMCVRALANRHGWPFVYVRDPGYFEAVGAPRIHAAYKDQRAMNVGFQVAYALGAASVDAPYVVAEMVYRGRSAKQIADHLQATFDRCTGTRERDKVRVLGVIEKILSETSS